MSAASIKMEVFNPNPSTLDFQFVQTLPNGDGQASSQAVQFNVNKAATPGTVFVNERNEGLVKAIVTSNHIITGGWAVVAIDGSFTDGSEEANKINGSVAVATTRRSNKEIWFLVKRVGSKKGNVTMTFFVQYKTST
jgi:hypothetical protein